MSAEHVHQVRAKSAVSRRCLVLSTALVFSGLLVLSNILGDSRRLEGLFGSIYSDFALRDASRLVFEKEMVAINETVQDWDLDALKRWGRSRAKLCDTNRSAIPLVIWPIIEMQKGVKAPSEERNLIDSGLQYSPVLKRSDALYNFDPQIVWVVDKHLAGNCNNLDLRVKEAQRMRAEANLTLFWPVIIYDYRDPFERASTRCAIVEQLLGPRFVKYAQRSIVSGRDWNESTQWVDLGAKSLNLHREFAEQHSGYFVRTDTVETVQDILAGTNASLASPLETLPRTVDVAHYFPVNMIHGDGKLRSKVSQHVKELSEIHNLSAVFNIVGGNAERGRTGAIPAYVDHMLHTKIVIAVQRDSWEDHYRLFEAMVSGAMVMMDRMHAFPTSLTNGSDIVVFSSAAELRFMILYYLEHEEERLAIARRGRWVAMARNRAWHRLEEMLFGIGTAPSRCYSEVCPYVAHLGDECPETV